MTSKFEHEFVDTVQGLRTEGRSVKVLFRLQAAEYTLEADSPHFEEAVVALIQGWEAQSPVQLVVVGTKVQAARPGD